MYSLMKCISLIFIFLKILEVLVFTLVCHFSLLLPPILLKTQCNFVINRFSIRIYIRILKYTTSEKNEYAGKTKVFIILYVFAGPDAASIFQTLIITTV